MYNKCTVDDTAWTTECEKFTASPANSVSERRSCTVFLIPKMASQEAFPRYKIPNSQFSVGSQDAPKPLILVAECGAAVVAIGISLIIQRTLSTKIKF